MKKNLLALAVAGAFAAPAAALAQGSFVQIYGTLNADFQGASSENGAPLPIGTGPLGFGSNYGVTGGFTPANGFSIRPTGVNSQAAGVRDAAFTEIATQAGLSSNSSNIGFRGSEDLGGGLKAIFQVESSIFLDTGSGNLGGRNSNLGLSGGWGTVFYGQWDTPYKFITLKIDPFYATSAASFNSLIGSPGFNVLSATFSGATLSPVASLTQIAADAAFDRRQGNSVQYWTPNWAGFSGRLFYSPGEGKQNYAIDPSLVGPRTAQLDPWMWGASLQYDNGPIYAALGYEQHKDYFGTRVQTGSTALGTGSDDWGAKVVLGAQNLWGFNVYGFYERLDYSTDGLVTTGLIKEAKRNAFGGFVTWGFGNFTLRGGWAQASDTSCASVVSATLATNQICNGSDTGTNQYSLGASYNFSKRTSTYIYYTKQDNDDIGRYRMGTNTGPVQGNVGIGQTPQAYGIGIRHTF